MSVNPVYGGIGNSNENAPNSLPRQKTTHILIGWDKSKSFMLLGLIICFVIWAALFFPLAF